MERLQVRVKRFFAPDEDEILEIENAFREFDMDARVEGTLFGGPAEFIAGVTVATAIAQFFNAFLSKAGEDAYLSFKSLIKRLSRYARVKQGTDPGG